MLFGAKKKLSELVIIFQERKNDLDMQRNKLSKEHASVLADIRENPPRTSTLDARPLRRLEISKQIEEINSEMNWLESKITEAEIAIDLNRDAADQVHEVTLKDMIRLGIEDQQEVKTAE